MVGFPSVCWPLHVLDSFPELVVKMNNTCWRRNAVADCSQNEDTPQQWSAVWPHMPRRFTPVSGAMTLVTKQVNECQHLGCEAL